VIGIDTNVLVRFLTNDDPGQAQAAKRLLAARTADDPAYVSLIVLVEALWVVQRAYGYSREGTYSLVEQMLSVDSLRFERAKVVDQAVRIAQNGGFDLPDVLIAVINSHAGCATTQTFDRRAARIPGMTHLTMS
jgi:predicted nucleic-acid-binding protein